MWPSGDFHIYKKKCSCHLLHPLVIYAEKHVHDTWCMVQLIYYHCESILSWPGNSFSLNAIENISCLFKSHVCSSVITLSYVKAKIVDMWRTYVVMTQEIWQCSVYYRY